MRTALAALAWAACYAPHYPEGLTCATGTEPCPPGQTCGTDDVCRATMNPPDGAMADGQSAVDGRALMTWIPEPSGTTGDLHGVWGQPGDVFAVGKASAATGLVLRRGTSGTWSPTIVGEPLAAISGATGNIWAVGAQGQAYQLAGNNWVLHTTGNSNFGGVVRGVGGPVIGALVGSNDAFYVDTGAGYQPQTLNLTPPPTFTAITLDAANRLWFVGDQMVVKYESGVPTLLAPTGAPTTEHFASVIGDAQNLYVGSDAHLWHTQVTPGSWDVVSGPPGCAGLDVDDGGGVWCASAQGIYKGTVGGGFGLDFAPAGVMFTAIHVVGTEVYAVGLGGVIWHRTKLD